ncbi:hypothetical protein N9263_00690 [Candidatus Marinimicrobia bacterium]|nr:hypothetical protein [Candidatus Neomarinimicrobiota bacterium]
MKKILFLTLIINLCFSEINFSGDARFRPRYDIKENGDNSSTSDLYYLYRARLNVKVDIGDGWFFNSKIGTNSVAGMTKMGDVEFTNKPELSFMEIYFGYQDEDCGYWAGLLPLKSNPSLDIHFYYDKLVDIPFVLNSNSSIAGIAGFSTIFNNKLNWFLSMDENNTNLTVDALDQETESSDVYTLGLDVNFDLGPISTIPRVIVSMGDEDDITPLTYGAEFKLPTFSKIKSSLSYYMSSNGKDGDLVFYESNHTRFLITAPIDLLTIGDMSYKGKLKFFYDMASIYNDDVSYLWLSYTQTCYKGDMGEVTISPTYRLQNGKPGDTDYSRNKIELTTQIKFK